MFLPPVFDVVEASYEIWSLADKRLELPLNNPNLWTQAANQKMVCPPPFSNHFFA